MIRGQQQSAATDHCFLTQEQIAADWGITRARVHQIEKAALAKLRRNILRELTAKNCTLAEWAGLE